jgi:Tfp pilus assembly protein PilF
VNIAKEGDVEKAVSFFKRALRIDPNYAPAQKNLKMAFQKMKQEVDPLAP